MINLQNPPGSPKSAGSLFNFNPEDPAELLATAADLPSMRGMSDKLASPRSTARRSCSTTSTCCRSR